LIAVRLLAGDGNDTVIGTPFNDYIDSGLGDDRVTGGPGLDTFVDAGGFDTLIETQNIDMSLFNNKFVTGTILGDNGGTFGKTPADTLDTLVNAIGAENPTYNFHLTDTGDRYASGATVENLNNIFE